MTTISKMKKLAEMPREQIAARTFQRVVYRRLVDLQLAIWEAKRAGAELGVTGELDTRHLIDEICKIGDIEHRSIAENPAYEPPALPSIETVADQVIFDVNEVTI